MGSTLKQYGDTVRRRLRSLTYGQVVIAAAEAKEELRRRSNLPETVITATITLQHTRPSMDDQHLATIRRLLAGSVVIEGDGDGIEFKVKHPRRES